MRSGPAARSWSAMNCSVRDSGKPTGPIEDTVACWEATRLSAWMPTTYTVSPVAGSRSAKRTAATGVSPSWRGS